MLSLEPYRRLSRTPLFMRFNRHIHGRRIRRSRSDSDNLHRRVFGCACRRRINRRIWRFFHWIGDRLLRLASDSDRRLWHLTSQSALPRAAVRNPRDSVPKRRCTLDRIPMGRLRTIFRARKRTFTARRQNLTQPDPHCLTVTVHEGNLLCAHDRRRSSGWASERKHRRPIRIRPASQPSQAR